MKIDLNDEILLSVEKPARYTGNEWNMTIKDVENIDIRFAFCFPDLYEVGMSHLGMKILYHVLNNRDDTYCERVFSPWVDMEQKMKENNIPIYTLETKTSLDEFDIIGFTLLYEMLYTNVLSVLDMAGIPLFSKDRTKEHPFICAGGSCVCNPEPISDFIDFFIIGEGEEVINEILDCYKIWKKSNGERIDFLKSISNIEGVYVPSFYNVEYNEDNTIKSFKKNIETAPDKIKKRIIKDLDKVEYPDKFIVPFINVVHDRAMLELFRGCIRGCRFCQAGYVYRPVREKSNEKLLEISKKLLDTTGYEEISLLSLSTSDYTQLMELSNNLLEFTEKEKVSLALPSLRIDDFSIDLMEKVQKVRKSGLTFAPEAGTQRLRDVINKGITEEDVTRSAAMAFNGGWSTIKLYFMLGLPTETFDDIEGIADLASKVVGEYFNVPKEKRAKGLRITLSASGFVPKPFTPFQWESQSSREDFVEKQKFLKSKIKEKAKRVSYNWHESKTTILEGAMSRGDRRLGKVIYSAFKKGCHFDAWDEHMQYEKWMEAFNENNVDIDFYTKRKRSFEEILPWDHIDIGVNKEFFISEAKKAYEGKITPNCRQSCAGCGAICFDTGICKK